MFREWNSQWEDSWGPSSSLDGGIPEEAWTGKKVNYSFLKTFGCEAFVHINKENRTKLEAKSKKCSFIGYGVNDFGYRFYDYENHKITRSRYVIFNEKVLYKNQLQEKKQEKRKHRVHSAWWYHRKSDGAWKS